MFPLTDQCFGTTEFFKTLTTTTPNRQLRCYCKLHNFQSHSVKKSNSMITHGDTDHRNCRLDSSPILVWEVSKHNTATYYQTNHSIQYSARSPSKCGPENGTWWSRFLLCTLLFENLPKLGDVQNQWERGSAAPPVKYSHSVTSQCKTM